MRSKHIIHTIDSHTGGEPTRLVVSGIPLKGNTLLEQREYMRNNFDGIRTTLMCEPRGHRGMFGAVMAPPTNDDVDFGIIWMDGSIYMNMCGHGTIGIGTTVVEAGLVPVTEPVTRVKIDMPAGLVTVDVEVNDGKAERAGFINVPAFLYARDVMIDVADIGKVSVDIAFGGNFFAAVRSEDIGLKVRQENTESLVRIGMAVLKAVNEQVEVKHPTLDHIRSIDLVTIYGPSQRNEAKYKNIHVFSERQFDRSPGGTGTSHMMAILEARGKMSPDETIVSEGIMGSLFQGRIVGKTKVGDFDAIIPEITGTAHITGFHQFVIDPEDPLQDGFVIG